MAVASPTTSCWTGELNRVVFYGSGAPPATLGRLTSLSGAQPKFREKDMKHSCRMATQRTMKIPPYPPLEKGGWGDFQVKYEERKPTNPEP